MTQPGCGESKDHSGDESGSLGSDASGGVYRPRWTGTETFHRTTLSWAIERVRVYDWDKDRVAHLGLIPTV